MFQIVEAAEAVKLIKDGDCVCVNSFLALSNAEELHKAIYRRFCQTGSPKELTMVTGPGFGMWDENRNAEPYIRAGAVKKLIAGHLGSMVSTSRLAMEGKLEAYNLPLGAISHAIRNQAEGLPGYLGKVGLGIFADPRVEGPGINSISTDKEIVKVAVVDGEEFLYYKLPRFDVAIIKGTSVDPNGNISFENEYVTVDALSIAQAAKANGGRVLVQVDRVSHEFSRPRDVIVPGALVDAVVVCEPEAEARASQTLSGDIHVPSTHLQYWFNKLAAQNSKRNRRTDDSGDIIGRRAARELKAGDIVNIGIGIPEQVGKYASISGMLKDISLTVEAGGMGGLPAAGAAFGATIGADMICDMAMQFDFYDGGGLDVCFMGALEVDRFGNVNAHRGEGGYVGIGGFANITSATKNVVFCLTFDAKGLSVADKAGSIEIQREGSVPKFCQSIRSISFSAERAIKNGQRVLYVTERCVFSLTPQGLRLVEVYPGIDAQRDVLDRLPFEVLWDDGVVCSGKA